MGRNDQQKLFWIGNCKKECAGPCGSLRWCENLDVEFALLEVLDAGLAYDTGHGGFLVYYEVLSDEGGNIGNQVLFYAIEVLEGVA